jgi:hypothetical protein
LREFDCLFKRQWLWRQRLGQAVERKQEQQNQWQKNELCFGHLHSVI